MNLPLISTYLELCKRKWSVEENDDEKTINGIENWKLCKRKWSVEANDDEKIRHKLVTTKLKENFQYNLIFEWIKNIVKIIGH